jgi:hypothetical protein
LAGLTDVLVLRLGLFSSATIVNIIIVYSLLNSLSLNMAKLADNIHLYQNARDGWDEERTKLSLGQ